MVPEGVAAVPVDEPFEPLAPAEPLGAAELSAVELAGAGMADVGLLRQLCGEKTSLADGKRCEVKPTYDLSPMLMFTAAVKPWTPAESVISIVLE